MMVVESRSRMCLSVMIVCLCLCVWVEAGSTRRQVEEVEVRTNGHSDSSGEFWDHVMATSTEDLPLDAEERQRSEVPRALMEECPRLSRCVGRNFCNDLMMITEDRDNRLTFIDDRRGFLACVDRNGNNLGVCCMDMESIVAGVDPGLQDIFLATMVEEVEEMLTAEQEKEEKNEVKEKEAAEEVLEDEDSSEKAINENSVEDIEDSKERETKEIVLNSDIFPGDDDVIVNEEDDRISVKLLEDDDEGGNAAEQTDFNPIVVINVNTLRTQQSLIDAIKMNRNRKSRVKAVAMPSIDELDYLDFDNDYIVITLQNEYEDGSVFRASVDGSGVTRQLRISANQRPRQLITAGNQRPRQLVTSTASLRPRQLVTAGSLRLRPLVRRPRGRRVLLRG